MNEANQVFFYVLSTVLTIALGTLIWVAKVLLPKQQEQQDKERDIWRESIKTLTEQQAKERATWQEFVAAMATRQSTERESFQETLRSLEARHDKDREAYLEALKVFGGKPCMYLNPSTGTVKPSTRSRKSPPQET